VLDVVVRVDVRLIGLERSVRLEYGALEKVAYPVLVAGANRLNADLALAQLHLLPHAVVQEAHGCLEASEPLLRWLAVEGDRELAVVDFRRRPIELGLFHRLLLPELLAVRGPGDLPGLGSAQRL